MTTIPALIRDLHAAGWSYRVTHEESPRDADGAPWDEGCYVHTWSRGNAEISVARSVGGPLVGDVLYLAAAGDADEDPDYSDQIQVGLGLVKRHGAAILRGLGQCAGVFTFGGAPATSRPAPVGSWWETPDGAAYVDGDYLDGPGDQIVTYVLHRRDGGRAWGKWGGREFADAYTRLDGPPAWCTPVNPDPIRPTDDTVSLDDDVNDDEPWEPFEDGNR